MKFLDQAKIFLRSGSGGGGCISFRREKSIPFGGPDGGNGGAGGNIILIGDNNLNTLIDFRYKQHFKARRGHHGMGRNRSGAMSDHIEIPVPLGTQVFRDDDDEELIADITFHGQHEMILKGGRGGLGNAAMKTSVNRAPRFAQDGEEGEELWVWLRLKLLANVGFVGLPNAGKSTLLTVLSRAQPKIGAYPFTTLHPHLGLMHGEYGGRDVILADLPGLIEGANEGKGMGHRFLGHAERCQMILHLISVEEGSDPIQDYFTICHEIASYGQGLDEKPKMIVLSKSDLITEKALDKIIKKLRKNILKQQHNVYHKDDVIQIMTISSHAMLGINELKEEIRQRFYEIDFIAPDMTPEGTNIDAEAEKKRQLKAAKEAQWSPI